MLSRTSKLFFLKSICIVSFISQDVYAATGHFPLTANVAYTSNYLSRGLTQSNDHFSLQGGFDYAHESGFYLGTWAAGVEYRGTSTGALPAAFQEIDGYGGFKGKISPDSTYDIGLIRYAYPGANSSLNYDFNEVYASLGYRVGDLGLGVGVKYSNNYWGGSGNATYTHASADYKLDAKWSISAHVGHQSVEDSDAWGHEDHTVVGLSGDYALTDHYTASVRWSKTDLSGDPGDNRVYAVFSMRF